MALPAAWPSGHVPTSSEVADLFSAAEPVFKRKTADQSVTNSTTLVNDTELFLSVAANRTYVIDSFLIYDGAGATAFKLAFTGPSGATFDWWQDGNSGGNSAASGTTWWGYNQIGTTNSTYGAAGAGSKLACRPAGILIVGANAGTFQLQFAQGSSSATATHLFTGSCLWARWVA